MSEVEALSNRVALMEGSLFDIREMLARLAPAPVGNESQASSSSSSTAAPLAAAVADPVSAARLRTPQPESPTARLLEVSAVRVTESTLATALHPVMGARAVKPVKRGLSEAGFFAPTVSLSQRRKGDSGKDPAAPWKTLLQASSEALGLLGGPPASSDVQACDWYSRISTLLSYYQGQALAELAQIEAGRLAPSVSKELAQAALLATWPNWTAYQLDLARLQRDAASAAMFKKSFKPAPNKDGAGSRN